MNAKIKNYLGIAIIAGIFLLTSAAFWYVISFSKSIVFNRTFQVSGEGKVVAVPDVAELSFGVLTEGGKNLTVSQKENTEKVNRINLFLKENGIEEKDIKTQFYNITPRYQYYSCPPSEPGKKSKPCPPPEIVGYSINQNVLVKIRDLNKAGDIVAGVVENGANTISGPRFTIDDPTDLQNQARQEAINKAKEKAKAIAKAGNFRLGKLLSVQENVSSPSPIPFERFSALSREGESGGPTIEPGSQEIRVNVTLTYEIR